MKKLILCLAVCFGFFVCQNVAAQSVTKVNATPQTISAVGNGNMANNLTVSPNSGSVATKQAQQAQLQAVNSGGANTGFVAPQVTNAVIKNATPVQINAATGNTGTTSALTPVQLQRTSQKSPPNAIPLGGN